MYELIYEELTKEESDAYLERIGCSGEYPISKDTLDTLILAHQRNVPFENMDPYTGAAEIPLDKESLFNKIVERKRGGFCFELNGAFVMLLRSLGFEAYSVMARVVAGTDELRVIAHRASVIYLDGKRYVADVGFGGPMAPFAVEISSERQTVNGETFWVEELDNSWLLLRRLDKEGEVQSSIVFADLPLLQRDFVPFCKHIIDGPESRFRTARIVSIKTENGSKALTNNMYSVVENGVKTEYEVAEDEVESILKDSFGIIL